MIANPSWQVFCEENSWYEITGPRGVQVSIDLNRFLRSGGELIEAARLTAIDIRLLLTEPETMLCGTTLFEF